MRIFKLILFSLIQTYQLQIMKKFTLILSFVFMLPVAVWSQTVLLSTGFDNYIGTSATAPTGWIITWHSTSSPSFYTSTGNYGLSSPGYKLGINNATIVTPAFSGADSVKFWVKGNGVPFSVDNLLSVSQTTDSVTWTTIAIIDSLPTAGTVLSLPVNQSSIHVRFEYTKVSGNLAIDDITVIKNVLAQSPTAAFSFANPCIPGITAFTDNSGVIPPDVINGWSWTFGDGNNSIQQNPTHTYAAPGTYTVSLTVTSSQGSDNKSLVITVGAQPVANFSIVQNSTTVDFTNTSSISSGSISTTNWNFGNSATSTAPNPTYTYTTNGTYNVCLTVTSNNGCVHTQCSNVTITGVGVSELNTIGGINLFPNPASDHVNIAIDNPTDVNSVTIYNVIGKAMINQTLTSNNGLVRVDTSTLPAGTYLVRILGQGGVWNSRMNITR